MKMPQHVLFRSISFAQFVANRRATTLCQTNLTNRIQACGYAKKVVAKGKGKGVVSEEQKGPEVCKDPVRLTSYAIGVNIFKEGEDPKLKESGEYPEWLFQLNLDKPKKLDELEPDTLQYSKRVRKELIWRNNKLQKGNKF